MRGLVCVTAGYERSQDKKTKGMLAGSLLPSSSRDVAVTCHIWQLHARVSPLQHQTERRRSSSNTFTQRPWSESDGPVVLSVKSSAELRANIPQWHSAGCVERGNYSMRGFEALLPDQ